MTEMSGTAQNFSSIALLLPAGMNGGQELAEEMASFLAERSVPATIGNLEDPSYLGALRRGEADLIIAVGGDGTMLRAGDVGAHGGIPVLGVNLGRLGFLVEIKKDEWRRALERLLAGDYWLESRMRIRVERIRGEQISGQWEALNEGVVGRGRTGRPIRLIARVDDRYLATYVADALISATSTGSTAYALAAGGPVLPPNLRNLLLVPVAPHLSMDRSIVLPEGSEVRLRLDSDTEAELSCDGQIVAELTTGDEVTVGVSDRDAQFVRLQDPGYFFRNLTSFLNSDHPTGLQL